MASRSGVGRAEHDPDKPVKCAGVLLVQGSKVLLARRHPNRTWYPNVWDVVGGHVEAGESVLAAVVREAREELGIVIEGRRLVHLETLVGDDFVLELFAAFGWQGDIENCAPEEHVELVWFEPTEISGLSLAHPALVRLAATAVAIAPHQ